MTNEEALKTPNTKRKLLGMCQRRKLTFFGHAQRNHLYLMQRTIQQIIISGKRTRRRPYRRWIDDLEEWTGMKLT